MQAGQNILMKKVFKLYGERNTNTRYIETLIRLNLAVEQLEGVVPGHIKSAQKVLPGKEWLRDLYFSLSYKQNLGWKHTRVKSGPELESYDVLKRKVCFVSVTKNPYSWLLSLHRKPYNQQYQKDKPDFETFLQTPWQTVGRDNCETLLKSPVALWNIKNNAYLQLRSLNGLNITTEQIIQDPESIVKRIAGHFSISKRSDTFLNKEESTKDSSKNFAYYQDYYLNERWRDEISGNAIAIINKEVDRKLMSNFAYKVIGDT